MSFAVGSIRQQLRLLTPSSSTFHLASAASRPVLARQQQQQSQHLYTKLVIPARSYSTFKPFSASVPRMEEQKTGAFDQIYLALGDVLQNTSKNTRIPQPGGDVRAQVEDLEVEFATRNVFGIPTWPATPVSGRSIRVNGHSDAARVYAQLASVLRKNNVRNELRLQHRYEKPNQERRRKMSERHRKRFADLVRKKVQLVMALKARGA